MRSSSSAPLAAASARTPKRRSMMRASSRFTALSSATIARMAGEPVVCKPSPAAERPEGGEGGSATACVTIVKWKVEGGAVARLALHPHPAAHLFGQRPADGQSEAGAAMFAGDGGVCLAVRFKKPLLDLPRDSGAGIADAELDGISPILLAAA